MFRLLLAVGFSFLLISSTCCAENNYLIRDLTADIGSNAEVNAVGASGTLVGISQGEAFSWNDRTGYTKLPVPNGTLSSGAMAINDSGVAAGWTNTDGARSQAIVWNPNGTYRLLDNLPGAKGAVARGINNLGQVVGVSVFEEQRAPSLPPAYDYRLVTWQSDGSVTDLSAIPSILWTVESILDDGRIFGRIAGPRLGWIRNLDGSITQMPVQTADYAEYNAISADGLIAGSVQFAQEGPYWASVWNADGSLNRLLSPLSAEDDLCIAYDINSQGYAVGESSTIKVHPASISACLWTPEGNPAPLPWLSGSLYCRARLISDQGWIVGECQTGSGLHTVLWTPVPEPSGLAALACAIVGLLGFRRVKH